MLKKLLMKILRRVMLPLFEALTHRTQTPSVNQQIQTSLMTQWILAKRQNVKVFSEIQDAGFRCYSEFEEDGIILYLLSLIDARDRTVVEMCCGSGDECMAANLIINHGFKGHLFEGDIDRTQFCYIAELAEEHPRPAWNMGKTHLCTRRMVCGPLV